MKLIGSLVVIAAAQNKKVNYIRDETLYKSTKY